MSGSRARRILGWIGWIGAAALALALYAHHAALGRARDRLATTEPLAERAQIRDRLVGVALGEAQVEAVGGEGTHALATPDGRRLVWLVHPGECAACLDDLSEWRGLQNARTQTLTVLVGVSRERAARVNAEVPLPGRVGVDPEGRLAESLGVSDAIPSVFLVVDSTGTVLMSEARHAATSCDWSFPGQVAALMEGGDPRRVRGGT